MSTTKILARIEDQRVELVNVPLIASGSQGVLQIQCEFDSLWSGYSKAAVFYKTEDAVYHIPLTSNVATVPSEVLANDGEFFFGVMGVASNTRTTEVVRLQVKQGALSESAISEAPAPNIYKQLLASYGSLDARFNQIVAMKGTGNATTHTLSDEYVSGTIKTNGAVGYIEFTISKMSLKAGGWHYTDYCIAPEIAALCPAYLETTNSDINVTLEAADPNNEGWSRLLIENVGNTDYTTDMVTTARGVYPLATIYIAELADLRVNADGNTYGTAGTAVRIQDQKAVQHKEQYLANWQQAQARENIGAASIDPSEDHTKTRVTLTVTAGQVLDLRSIYRLENHGGVTRIDWGDDIKNNVVGTTDDEMKHTYATAGTYTITMTGLTHLPASTFRGKNVSALEIGSTVQYLGQLAFTENPDLSEVRIYAKTPPEIGKTSSAGPFGWPQYTKLIIIVPKNSLPAYTQSGNWVFYKDALTTEETASTVPQDKIVTVGQGGDFATINDALAYLSRYYPAYKAGGIKCEIQILAGTIITEQIFVERVDLSYITITSAASDNKVQVAPSAAWTGLSHDTRGNKPFISGENGARLPCIKCLFSCIVPEGGWVTGPTTEDVNCAVGYFCNRGSTGVIAGFASPNTGVLEMVGFENFYDNIIANNNSEIVLREAYARGAARYGVMSRHISRVSARSANITNCGDTAAYADRASMLDVRHADLTGSKNGIAAYHASTITANETVASSIPGTVADAQYGSTINCQAITAAGSKDAFKVTGGATIVATGAKVTNATGTKYSQTTNTLTANGVIYA